MESGSVRAFVRSAGHLLFHHGSQRRHQTRTRRSMRCRVTRVSVSSGLAQHHSSPGHAKPGLFRLIWDDLQTRRPACGYITNRRGPAWTIGSPPSCRCARDTCRCGSKPMDGPGDRVERPYRRVRARARPSGRRLTPPARQFGGRRPAAELAALSPLLHDATLTATAA